MKYIPRELREAVVERAENCCEYCRRSQEDIAFTFHVDHIIPLKHLGNDTLDNYCLSCPSCNTSKGSDIASIDIETRQLTPLYNPRQDDWNEHFFLERTTLRIVGKTSTGRVTVRILALNDSSQIRLRRVLVALGRYPCPPVGR